MLRFSVVLLLSSSIATAEVEHEISVGGGQSTLGAQVLAHTKIGARLIHAPEVEHRALACEPDPVGWLDKQCAWVFTGSDPHDPDDLGAEGQGDVWLAGERVDGVATARAWAHGAGWHVEEKLALQPIGDLHDRIWVSGRGVIEARTKFATAPMFALGNRDYQLSVLSVDGEWSQRWRDARRDPGFDHAGGVHFLRVLAPHVAIGFFDAKFWEQRIDQHNEGGYTYGVSAYGLDLRVLSVDITAGDVKITSHVGLTDQTPVYHSVSPATTTSKPVPWATATDYAVEATWRHGDFEAGLGIASWLRLGMDAEALDYGHLATATIGAPFETVNWKLRAEGGYLDRVGGSPFAPPPPRTREWMGRLASEIAWPVADHVDMVLRAWSERSDRDDPRWNAAPMSVVTHVGGDVTVRLH
ncbi:MAG: hypothetical protein NT062_19120 [Proteobacteria bacterium]|nr:hypothetical protein [Pseudomonadota bacterium]